MTRLSINEIFKLDEDEVSSKFEILSQYMALIGGLPDIKDPEDLLNLLTLDDDSDARKELEQRVLGRDLSMVPSLKKFKSVFLGNISVYQSQQTVALVRLNLLTEKTSLVI